MTDEQSDVSILEDEAAVVEMLQGDGDEEPTDQQKNLAIAQAELIGDI